MFDMSGVNATTTDQAYDTIKRQTSHKLGATHTIVRTIIVLVYMVTRPYATDEKKMTWDMYKPNSNIISLSTVTHST